MPNSKLTGIWMEGELQLKLKCYQLLMCMKFVSQVSSEDSKRAQDKSEIMEAAVCEKKEERERMGKRRERKGL